jgi:predicted transcriptional regulator
MARKKKTGQLTPLELELMKVLWETGPATVQQVHDHLDLEPPLAYTTIQTMLNVLHRKGRVKRSLKDRAYRYRAAVTRDQIVSSTMKDIIDRMFGGSAESLVMSLIQTRHLTPEKLEKLRRHLDDQSEEPDGKHH